MIRRALARRSPEELLLIPVVILIGLAILAQPSSITRLFETPYATPIPGDSPADVILNDRSPSPAPSPVTMPRGDLQVFDRAGRSFQTVITRGCPAELTLREISVALEPNAPLQTIRVCVDAEGSVITWDASTGQRLRVLLAPSSVAGR